MSSGRGVRINHAEKVETHWNTDLKDGLTVLVHDSDQRPNPLAPNSPLVFKSNPIGCFAGSIVLASLFVFYHHATLELPARHRRGILGLFHVFVFLPLANMLFNILVSQRIKMDEYH